MELLKFYASWCEPCKIIKNYVDSIPDRFQTKVTAIDVDTDYGETMSVKHKIKKLPTLVLLNEGKEVFRLEQPDEKTIEHMLLAHVKKNEFKLTSSF
jgi:thiol-disulfide isomerase/thioredoxin